MDLFELAVCFAADKHSGQRRTTGEPYLLHPLEAAAIVGTMTSDPEVLAAAVLHDTVEDAHVTFEELTRRFGPRVAELVRSETEDKRANRPPDETWKLRKEESLRILASSRDIAVKMIWLGDKLSNARSFYRMYRQVGDRLWQNFHQKDPAVQAWHYRRIAECLSELRDTDAYREYVALIGVIFENVPEDNERYEI